MEKVPTFAEFVKEYFPEEERPKGFHLEFIERISEQIEKMKPGDKIIFDQGRHTMLYRNLTYQYHNLKNIGIPMNSVFVDDCIGMPNRLHEADELGHIAEESKIKVGIVGAASERGILLSRIAEMGLNDKIEIINLKQDNDVSELIKLQKKIFEECNNIESITALPPKAFGKQKPLSHKRKPSRYGKK